MSIAEKMVNLLARWLNWVGAAALLASMVIVCINVVGRGFFHSPLKGTVDIASLLGGFIIAGAIAYTQVLKGHIRIGLFVERLPKRLSYLVESLMSLISLVLFAIISWQTILFADMTQEIGELSEVLKIPLTPVAWMVSIGCISLTLVLLFDLIKSILKVVGR